MRFLYNYPEIIPLVVNTIMTVAYFCKQQHGKTLYWLGATILTAGLIKMKG